MRKHYPLFLCCFGLWVLAGYGQQPEAFTLSDFQMRGPVKVCVVKAQYGEERFEFDREGRLRKSLTRYGPEDYDITYYRYRDSILYERRDEVYRSGDFDPRTSIAHIYERDSATGPVQTETILSYDRSIQEKVDYRYNDRGILQRMVRVTPEGVDDTRLTYDTYQGEETISYVRNGELQRSVRRSGSRMGSIPVRVVLTKEYSDGLPREAVEETLDMQGRRLKEVRFAYDTQKESFVPRETRKWTYNPESFPETETLVEHPAGGGRSEPIVRKYLYHMDGANPSNWVRQIVTPENQYVVRAITYYEEVPAGAVADSLRH
ncbi:hypothetical protein OZ410_12205 [Robiginitalea sp. M366]|uniref:hypothetical protein n=1 Tax=Robiginitalea aestuariiviva TaxID=3036903 RepID=UPI00240D9B87|nr:hypothetical protein [Robiginitalea aestuariiviva]MDG1573084.1 hypothetical protein [Robiginitalea aestuariiviva]